MDLAAFRDPTSGRRGRRDPFDPRRRAACKLKGALPESSGCSFATNGGSSIPLITIRTVRGRG